MFEDHGLTKEVTLHRTLKDETDLISREDGETVAEEMAEAKSQGRTSWDIWKRHGYFDGAGV